MRHTSQDFDRAFFQRYYGDAATRVADAGDATRLVRLIAGIVDYHGVRLKRVLDAGCGVGLLRAPLRRRYPGVRYEGLEVSPFLCRKFGWHEDSLDRYRPARRFDLVICHDVLQYLPDRAAAAAIANLARLTQAALYLSVLTRRDWQHAADQSRTDRDVHLRSAEWYRSRLRRHFRHLGSGVYLARPLQPILWELEQPWT